MNFFLGCSKWNFFFNSLRTPPNFCTVLHSCVIHFLIIKYKINLITKYIKLTIREFIGVEADYESFTSGQEKILQSLEKLEKQVNFLSL